MPRTIRVGPKRWSGRPSRLQEQAQNNLGIIMTDEMNRNQQFRTPELEILDAYYESRQYDDLQDWNEATISPGEYVPTRKRKPRIIYNLPKVLVDKVASKLFGAQVFPTFLVEDDPDDTEFFRSVQQVSNFRRSLMQPGKHLLISGSVFVRFYLVEGFPVIEHFNAKYCYPVFDETDELDSIEIRYVYEDPSDKDAAGRCKKKWYRMVLSKNTDILYDNPEFQSGMAMPKFTVVEENKHGLGFVQGEWFRTEKHKFSPDGYSVFGEILDFCDELNYSLSQTSQAVGYSQEPQLTVNNIDEDELDSLIKSSQKAWNLGHEGKAQFLESNLAGAKVAEEQRDHMRTRALDVARVIIHDPEKMAGHAQSGKALEILHGPLVELVDELRTMIEPCLRNLLVKLGMALIETSSDVIDVPKGYQPESVDITLQWPAIFPLTLEDIAQKVAAAVQATTANILSRESATRWIASEFGIENVEEELKKIESQPILNPFGSFGGGGFGGGGGKPGTSDESGQ